MGGFSPPKGRSVEVAAGKFVSLPNGKSYQDNETVELTNDEWLQISPAVVDAGIIIDHGAVGSEGGDGSGVGFDFVTVDGDQPSGTDGQTWMEIVNPTFVAPEWTAATPFANNAIVQPSTPNGHWYNATGAGTTDADTEPTWVTDGSTVVDNDITWQDDGLIADQALSPAVRIYVHKDGQWDVAINGAFAPDDPNNQAGSFFNFFAQSAWGAIDANTITRASITLDAAGNGITLTVNSADDTTSFGLVLDDADGVGLFGTSAQAIGVAGDQALGFFGAAPVEAADRPVVNDITDLDALKDYLVTIGLLQGGG